MGTTQWKLATAEAAHRTVSSTVAHRQEADLWEALRMEIQQGRDRLGLTALDYPYRTD